MSGSFIRAAPGLLSVGSLSTSYSFTGLFAAPAASFRAALFVDHLALRRAKIERQDLFRAAEASLGRHASAYRQHVLG
jgi:hypothetical protein